MTHYKSEYCQVVISVRVEHSTTLLSKLSAVLNDNPGAGLSRSGSNRFDSFDDVHSLDNRPKDNVLSIQPGSIGRAQKELGSICVGSGVGHGQDTGACVSKLKVFIGELVSVNGFSSGSVVVGEITSLAHESWNHPVETGSLESKSLFSAGGMICFGVRIET